MAKQRSAKSRPARAKRGQAKPAKTRAGKAPAKTLIEFTERGFDALRERRLKGAGTATTKGDKKGAAFADAVERLKADYDRVLKRSK